MRETTNMVPDKLDKVFFKLSNYRLRGMESQMLRAGIIITGPKWPEPVEIKRVDYNGDYVHIVGATTLSSRHIDQLIPTEELTEIRIKTIQTDFKSEAWKVFLALEAKRSSKKDRNYLRQFLSQFA